MNTIESDKNNSANNHGDTPFKLTWNAIRIILLAIIGIIVISFVDFHKIGKPRPSYEERILTVKEIEVSQPTKFLSAEGTYKENFFGDKFKVNCIITNRATVTTYKDAIVRVTYYSKTKTVLGSKDYTIYEEFRPISSTTCPLTIDNFKNVNAIGWAIQNAAVK